MRELEFGLTGFYPAFHGVERAKLHEAMGFDIQGFMFRAWLASK
jgi:hypothetical protein